jgi:hypothetical protein
VTSSYALAPDSTYLQLRLLVVTGASSSAPAWVGTHATMNSIAIGILAVRRAGPGVLCNTHWAIGGSWLIRSNDTESPIVATSPVDMPSNE